MENENRLFAYIDILGFKELVKTKESDISAILKKFINSYPLRMNKYDFEMIYFSDTVIFYTKTPGFNQQLFWDMAYIAQVFVVEMLQNEIPVRGVITYGELNIDIEEESKIKMFWGQGLIDAYEAETTENIIGLFILPEALIGFESIHGLEECYPGRFHVKYDGRVLINLFPRLAGIPKYEDDILHYIYEDPEILNEIKAYYVLEKLKDRHTGKIADKYKNALKLAEKFIYHDISYYRNFEYPDKNDLGEK
jgi:hypothetical protein